MNRIYHSAYFVVILLLYCSGPATAGSRELLQADFLYRQMAFHDAIPHYEKLAGQSEHAGAYVYERLGDCFRLTKDPAQAVHWYQLAAKQTSGKSPLFELHYGEVLMMLQRYDEAKARLELYQAANPSERRVSNMIRGCSESVQPGNLIPAGVTSFQAFNTDGSDFGPALWQDRLVFTTDSSAGRSRTDNWTGNPYYSIYTVPCNPGGQCGGQLAPIGGKLNTRYHDGPAFFSEDGRNMYFTRTSMAQQLLETQPVSDQGGTVRLQIMIAEDYDQVDKKFRKISPFRYNNRNYVTAHPTISPDGSMLVFVSDMPGGEGSTDLYMCRRSADGSWSAPENLGKAVNTEGEEMFPSFIDNKTLSFSSNSHPGQGGLDIFYASWDAASKGWGEPVNAGQPLNSSYDDMSLVMSSDHKNGFFASNRPAARKGDNIYHFLKQQVHLSLMIRDSITGKPLEGAQVLLKSTEESRHALSGPDGSIMTPLFPQTRYELTISKVGYRTTTVPLATHNLRRGVDTVNREVLLGPEVLVRYSAVVLDEASHSPVQEPLLVISSSAKWKADSVRLKTGEIYERSLDPGHTYNIYAVKENYYGNEKVVSTKGIIPGGAPVSIRDTVFMKQLRVGEVYKIDNIYYDFNKANIREDAKPSLDRLLELLGMYPEMEIQVNSHTDCRGSDAYNLKLSDQRAASVIRYLNERGIARNRLKSKGFGESAPVERCNNCDLCTEDEHQRNRRTEFQIIAM